MPPLSNVHAAFRVALEVAALVGWGAIGWRTAGVLLPGGPWRWLSAVALVSVAAVLWATFRVPGDAGAAGPPVAIGGPARLALELAILLGASAALTLTGSPRSGVILGVLVILHYATTWGRVTWLLTHRGSTATRESHGAS